MTEEKIHLEQEGPKGRFFLLVGPDTAAEMFISFPGSNRLVIEHTEVLPGHEGKGYGKRMIEHAVNYARENKLRVIPFCLYAREVLRKTKEYQDVL